ncbi:hypothetical protein DJ568_13055 [Mucilaginibacter hurinus]|uniref:Uncharacterized protein n=1 Tax=Mucilaginibacter hurinus TaxID=2201324 RepID=A0A367GL60_9SPHI|nr:hypothetical protein [Mucilaginibacter hurinus]RCH54222.1 hypothetical protein DJ568_13055 [Mucilaginibacter hurinus]
MQNTLYTLLLTILTISAGAQNKHAEVEKRLIKYFQQKVGNHVVVTKEKLNAGSVNKNINISVSESLIDFDTIQSWIINPYFSQKFKESEDEKIYQKNFPRSFSVLYNNALVSLFENGKFACFKLNNLERDKGLENKLNTKLFDYHWISGDRLAGLSGGVVHLWNGEKWIKLANKFPLKHDPKLFEDEKFLVYRDCHGEWGGTVYFFEKATSKTFFTESTCANSVIKANKGYIVLANLGHGFGSTEAKVIADPTKLTLAKSNQIGKTVNGQALGYTDKSNAFKKEMDFYGLQVFSSFKYHDKVLYLVHFSELTFIAEIKGDNIEIVHPLFFNNLYTHNPVTSKYGDYTLINLDHYGTGLDREIAIILIKDNKITKLDWNDKHNY